MDCDHPEGCLEASKDPKGIYVLCSKCNHITRNMYQWLPYQEGHFIVHPNSGTYMAADECWYVITHSEEQIEALNDEDLDRASALGAHKYEVGIVAPAVTGDDDDEQ